MWAEELSPRSPLPGTGPLLPSTTSVRRLVSVQQDQSSGTPPASQPSRTTNAAAATQMGSHASLQTNAPFAARQARQVMTDPQSARRTNAAAAVRDRKSDSPALMRPVREPPARLRQAPSPEQPGGSSLQQRPASGAGSRPKSESARNNGASKQGHTRPNGMSSLLQRPSRDAAMGLAADLLRGSTQDRGFREPAQDRLSQQLGAQALAHDLLSGTAQDSADSELTQASEVTQSSQRSSHMDGRADSGPALQTRRQAGGAQDSANSELTQASQVTDSESKLARPRPGKPFELSPEPEMPAVGAGTASGGLVSELLASPSLSTMPSSKDEEARSPPLDEQASASRSVVAAEKAESHQHMADYRGRQRVQPGGFLSGMAKPFGVDPPWWPHSMQSHQRTAASLASGPDQPAQAGLVPSQPSFSQQHGLEMPTSQAASDSAQSTSKDPWLELRGSGAVRRDSAVEMQPQQQQLRRPLSMPHAATVDDPDAESQCLRDHHAEQSLPVPGQSLPASEQATHRLSVGGTSARPAQQPGRQPPQQPQLTGPTPGNPVVAPRPRIDGQVQEAGASHNAAATQTGHSQQDAKAARSEIQQQIALLPRDTEARDAAFARMGRVAILAHQWEQIAQLSQAIEIARIRAEQVRP